MATSGRINGITYDGNGADKSSAYGTWINWQRNSYSIENNTSNITVTVYVQRIDSWNGVSAYDLTQKPSLTLTVGGSAKSPTIYYIDTRDHKLCTVATWTGNVSHNNDGTLNLAISCSYSTQLDYLRSGSISGTATLDTIPRASTISSVSGLLMVGEEITVNIARAVDTFTHQVWYKVGNSAWYDLGKGYTTSCKFRPDIATANQITTSTLGTMQVCVRTFNSSGTKIGEDYYEDVTIRTPPYTLNGTITLTGNNLFNGTYVQGRSTVTVKTTATEMYGATISYSATVDGKTYTGNNFTSDVLSNGNKQVSVTLTDTRGEKVTLTSNTFTVYPYADPYVACHSQYDRIICARCDENGELADDGTHLKVILSKKWSPLKNNTNKATLQYLVETTAYNSGWETLSPNTEGTDGTFNIDTIVSGVTLDVDKAYTVTFKCVDTLGRYTTIPSKIPMEKVTFHLKEGGGGAAFGKYAEEEKLLDVAWKTKIADTDWRTLLLKRIDATGAVTINFQNDAGSLGFIGMTGDAANTLLRRWTSDGATQYTVLDTGFVKDYVVEQGTSDVWTYEKWNNGVLKCFANQALSSVAVTTAWGSIYCSPQIALPSFPSVIAFKSTPQVNLTWNGAYSATTYGAIGVTTAKCGYTYICRPDSVTLSSGSIAIQVIGKWK